ncbi:hypothetical protein BLOT_001462 [Blomia tropicalis]|nr:hypothetical protein BLOT_001462 [Blomia tropicalis]
MIEKSLYGDSVMANSQFNLVQPRYIEKKESIDQYLVYFTDLVVANGWDEVRAAAVFKTVLPAGSDIRSFINSFTPEEQNSFSVIKTKIKKSREPVRDSLVTEFYDVSRKKGQSLDDLAARVVKLTDQLYPSMPKDYKVLIERDRFLAALNPELRVAIVGPQGSLKTLADVKNMASNVESSTKKFNETKQHKHGWHKGSNESNRKENQNQTSSFNRPFNRNYKKDFKGKKSEVAAINIDGSQDDRRQFVKCIIGNKQVMALVDTGSRRSIVSMAFEVQKSNFNLCDLSDEEISAVLVEDLSFGDEESKCKTASSNLRLCIPQSRVVEVLNMCHNQMNHIGQQKVIDVVYHRFYWPGWRNDVKQFIRKCDCNIIKDMEVKPKAPLLVTDIDKFKRYRKKMKQKYDTAHNTKMDQLGVGVKVLVKHPTIRKGSCQKLLPANKGPFTIAKIEGPASYIVTDNFGNMLKVHRDQIKVSHLKKSAKIAKRGRTPRGM